MQVGGEPGRTGLETVTLCEVTSCCVESVKELIKQVRRGYLRNQAPDSVVRGE